MVFSEDSPVLTVDGPSGSGKGTLSVLLAKKLGWNLLDSGALYRVLAYESSLQHISPEHVNDLVNLVPNQSVQFFLNHELIPKVTVMNRNMDVTQAIRTENCAQRASKIAVIPELRKGMLQWQRSYKKFPGLVADGRDMGTVVFPEATLKLYIDASSSCRAKRRYDQLKSFGHDVRLERILDEVIERDRRDRTRQVAPLKPAQDAILLDTSSMTIEEVLDKVLGVIEKRVPEWLSKTVY